MSGSADDLIAHVKPLYYTMLLRKRLIGPAYSYGYVVLGGAGLPACASRPTVRATYAVKDCRGPVPSAAGLSSAASAGIVAGVVGAALAAVLVWRRRLTASGSASPTEYSAIVGRD